MKPGWLKEYISFSRGQTMAVAALLVIILLIICFNVFMPFFVATHHTAYEKELTAAWERYQKEHLTAGHVEERTASSEGTLFRFDPNTLDSNGFIALGLKPKTIHLLLNWRRKGKVFYKKEDLKPLYTLTAAEYNRLEPFIAIATVRENQVTPAYAKPSVPEHIDLNTTDSATLVLLNGIGPVLAHRIIERRTLLGGYLKHEQLLDVYKFPDSVYQMLQEKLVIDPQKVKRLNLNTATIHELKQHPYIGEKMAKNIILYREGLKRFQQIDQLRQVPLMDEEKYRKIAPYFTLE